MLLHIEEIQMQKDIRNYDMKGVEFDQDGTDRRFLMLKVSENFACSMKTKCIPVRLPTAVYSCNLWSTVEAVTNCSKFPAQQQP